MHWHTAQQHIVLRMVHAKLSWPPTFAHTDLIPSVCQGYTLNYIKYQRRPYCALTTHIGTILSGVYIQPRCLLIYGIWYIPVARVTGAQSQKQGSICSWLDSTMKKSLSRGVDTRKVHNTPQIVANAHGKYVAANQVLEWIKIVTMCSCETVDVRCRKKVVSLRFYETYCVKITV
jgi:hypothetical protein